MLMKDSTAVNNKWCMPVNLFCLTPGLLSTRSKVIKYKCKKFKQNHRDYDKEK